MRQIMIAGVSSGVGKTTLTLGIMQALKNKGLDVQPYKVGPDYIDTGFHCRVCERPSINLDEFMIPDDAVLKSLYLRALLDADIGVVEGVMGLYDGFGVDKRYCSSAGIAQKLNIPVILVIDGKATSTSAAAVVKGFMELDPTVNIEGVIVNRVASHSHYQLIKEAIERYNSIKVIGYLKKNLSIELPSRHLGLVPDSELVDLDRKLETLAQEISETVDLDQLIQCAEMVGQKKDEIQTFITQSLTEFDDQIDGRGVTMAIAEDCAFSFYYPDNLSLLENIGVTLIPFSPLVDDRVPNADAYYFGGGFPELFAETLSENKSMLTSIREASNQGKIIFAECGGLMYLGETFKDQADRKYELVGLISGTSYMTSRLKRFGYCSFEPIQDMILAQTGWELRGHEFHHSDFDSTEAYFGVSHKTRDGIVLKEWKSGYAKDNLFASYLHIHFYQDPKFVKRWMEVIKQRKLER